jgi:RNA polymerase sigma-70 factor (ECF subfamily)
MAPLLTWPAGKARRDQFSMSHTVLTPPARTGMIHRTMGLGNRPRQDLHDGVPGPVGDSAGTLGDLLYADKAHTPVPEKDWVGLVQSIAAGDQGALHALYERTHRIAFTLIVRITNNRQTAEELTLDVFHDVWRRASTYDATGGSVVGWIMNQARSRAIDRLRFEQRKKRVNQHGDDPLPATAPRDPQEISDLKEQGRLLREALTVLRPEERQVIEAAFFSELTYDEVAARLNQPLGTVKTRVRAGLLKLRQALAKTVKEP